MKKLTAMTIGALAIGLCGYAVDASAQTPASCPKHDVTVFFAPDSAALNQYSTYTVNEIADAARACGANGVIVQVPAEGARAHAVATVLRGKGVQAVIVPTPTLVTGDSGMMARAVVLRVAGMGAGIS